MRHMWLLECQEKDLRVIFESIDDAVEEIKQNSDCAWTLEQLLVYPRKQFKIPDPNVILNQETGKVDEKKIRIAPMPLNRSGDVE